MLAIVLYNSMTTTEQSEKYIKFLKAKELFLKKEKARNEKHNEENYHLNSCEDEDHYEQVIKPKYHKNQNARIDRFLNKWKDERKYEMKYNNQEKQKENIIEMNSKEMYEAHKVVVNSQFDECCNCGEHSPIMHESEKWNGDICFACFVIENDKRCNCGEHSHTWNGDICFVCYVIEDGLKKIFKNLMNELKWTYPIKVLKYKYIPLRVSMRMDQKFYKGRFDFDQYRWWKKEFREDQKISRKKF